MKRKLLIAAIAGNAGMGVALIGLAIWAALEHVMIGVLAGSVGAVFGLFCAGCGCGGLVMMRRLDQTKGMLAHLQAEQFAWAQKQARTRE